MNANTEVLSYPQHHGAWLEVMGVSRWRLNGVIDVVDAVSDAVVTVDQTQIDIALSTTMATATIDVVDAPNALNARVELSKVATETKTRWAESIQNARYWVIGNAVLQDEEVALLAGMMAAIQATADEVVYSFCSSELDVSVQYTRVSQWSRLNVQPVLAFDSPPAVTVLVLGEDAMKTTVGFETAKVFCIPALSDILREPLLKRDAWQVLKAMRAQRELTP